ncbi:SgcJ/EcaC family oxidoreductase [Amaricoccus sp.]|uniref:YybH family protein n=1 Tax=Amaricoccus sp. TaxID=1872485 RepID=UPI002622BBAF|nr:SgcJ/EcaC family oxidoreductase [uncultured Amaricoccus sp.]
MTRANALRVATVLALTLSGPALADDAAEIKAAQASWEAAFAAGDGAAAAEAVFTEDARLLPPGEPMVVGREAIGAYWQAGIDAGFHSLKLGLTAVEVIGDTMIETGTWSIKFPGMDGGAEGEASGKALVIWKKGADGTWRMSQDMWSPDS